MSKWGGGLGTSDSGLGELGLGSAGEGVYVLAGVATGTGQTDNATILGAPVSVNAEAAGATGQAFRATVRISVNGAEASGAGLAAGPQSLVRPRPTAATATGAAAGVLTGPRVGNAETIAGTGVAYDALITTAIESADAEIATGTGEALDTDTSVNVNASPAQAAAEFFPYIAASSSGGLGTPTRTTSTVSIPAGAAGDMILVLFRVGSASGTALGFPVGWTELFNEATSSSSDRHGLAWKISDGTEASINITHGSWNKTAHAVWRVANPGPTPPVISSRATGSSVSPNSPSLSPGSSRKFLWLSLFTITNEVTLSAYPANYLLGQQYGSSGTTDGTTDNTRVGGAARQLEASSEDPGVFTVQSAAWDAYTVAIYPGPSQPNASAAVYASAGVATGTGAASDAVAAGGGAAVAETATGTGAALDVTTRITASAWGIPSMPVVGPRSALAATSSGSVSVAYASPLLAGDLAIILVETRGPSTASASGWNTLFSDVYSFHSHHLLYKWLDGTETGSVTVTITGAVGGIYGVMQIYRGVAGSPGYPAIESGGDASDVSNTVSHVAVTTTGPGRLAVCFTLVVDDSNTTHTLSGASGGTWIEDFEASSTVGNDARVLINHADMPLGSTVISGGTGSMAIPVEWSTRSFAFVPVGTKVTVEQAHASVSASAEVAAATGSALDATSTDAPQLHVNAEVATGTGSAEAVTALIAVRAGAPFFSVGGFGQAKNAQINVADVAVAEVATGTGSAYDATAMAQNGAFASAATGTGAAHNATIAVTLHVGVATGTGEAYGAVPNAYYVVDDIEGDIATGYMPPLAAPIDDNDTTIIVTTPSTTPPDVPFVVIIDGEQVLVTNVSGTTWTVERGYNGTTATSHGSGTVARPALARITVGGVDVTAFVHYQRTRFSTASNGQAGTAELWVRDLDRTRSFTSGKEVIVQFRGIRMWGGYVSSIRRQYVFPEGTGNVGDEPRWLVLDCVDYNVLFNKRIFYDPLDTDDMKVVQWPNGTWDSVVIRRLVDDFLDLEGDGLLFDIQHVGTPAMPQISCNPDAPDVFGVGSAGWTWGEVMNAIVSQTGAVYYIDPDKVFRYVDDGTRQSRFGWAGVSDAPDNVTTIGYRDFEWTSDGSRMTNDHLQWGAGQGSDEMVFHRERYENGQDVHGLWQSGELRYDLYCQDSVDLRASTWLYGSAQNRRGHALDRQFFRVTVREPYFRVADVLRTHSTEFGYDGNVPVRNSDITFLTPWDIQCVLTISHELDAPWTTHEFWIPTFNFNFPPIGPIRGPVFPPFPPIPPIEEPVWPPIDPCECVGVGTGASGCLVHDTFTRTDSGPDFGPTDSDHLWEQQEYTIPGYTIYNRDGSVAGGEGVLHDEPGFFGLNETYQARGSQIIDLNSEATLTVPATASFRFRYTGTWTSTWTHNRVPEDAADPNNHYWAPGNSADPEERTGNDGGTLWIHEFIQFRMSRSSPRADWRIYNAGGALYIAKKSETAVGYYRLPILIDDQLNPDEWCYVEVHYDSDRTYIKVWKEGATEPAYLDQTDGTFNGLETGDKVLELFSAAVGETRTIPPFTLFVDDVCVSMDGGGSGDCGQLLTNASEEPDWTFPTYDTASATLPADSICGGMWDVLVKATMTNTNVPEGGGGPGLTVALQDADGDSAIELGVQFRGAATGNTAVYGAGNRAYLMVSNANTGFPGNNNLTAVVPNSSTAYGTKNLTFWIRLLSVGSETEAYLWVDGDPQPGSPQYSFSSLGGTTPTTIKLLADGSANGASSVVVESLSSETCCAGGDDTGIPCLTMGELLGMSTGGCTENFSRELTGSWGVSDWGVIWEAYFGTGSLFVEPNEGTITGGQQRMLTRGLATGLPVEILVKWRLSGGGGTYAEFGIGDPDSSGDVNTLSYDAGDHELILNHNDSTTSFALPVEWGAGDGEWWWARYRMLSTTQSAGSMWPDGEPEPESWQLQVTGPALVPEYEVTIFKGAVGGLTLESIEITEGNCPGSGGTVSGGDEDCPLTYSSDEVSSAPGPGDPTPATGFISNGESAGIVAFMPESVLPAGPPGTSGGYGSRTTVLHAQSPVSDITGMGGTLTAQSDWTPGSGGSSSWRLSGLDFSFITGAPLGVISMFELTASHANIVAGTADLSIRGDEGTTNVVVDPTEPITWSADWDADTSTLTYTVNGVTKSRDAVGFTGFDIFLGIGWNRSSPSYLAVPIPEMTAYATFTGLGCSGVEGGGGGGGGWGELCDGGYVYIEPPMGGGETGDEIGGDPDESDDGHFFYTDDQFQKGSTEVWVDGLRIRLGSDYLEYPRTKKIEILDHIAVDANTSVRINYVIWTIENPAPTVEPL